MQATADTEFTIRNRFANASRCGFGNDIYVVGECFYVRGAHRDFTDIFCLADTLH